MTSPLHFLFVQVRELLANVGEDELIYVDEFRLVGWYSLPGVNRVDRALGEAGVAGCALVRIDVQHSVSVQQFNVGLNRMRVGDGLAVLIMADQLTAFDLVDALDRANQHTRFVLDI